MKEYPTFKRGDSDGVYKKLKGEEKRVFDKYLKEVGSHSSKKREDKVRLFLLQLRAVIQKPITKINRDDIFKFLTLLNRSDKANWTKNDIKKITKAFLKKQYKDYSLIEGDSDLRESFKGVSKKRAFNFDKINKENLIKPEEFEKILRASQSLKWTALFSLMYESGFRPCEIQTLRWKNLTFDDSNNICRITIVSPKTQDKRTIPVKNCVVHLKRWRSEYSFPNREKENFVFPSQFDKNKPMGDAVTTEMLKRICVKAKIRHIFPYLFRHSRIYEIQKKTNEKIASKFAGHSVETSEIYNHLDDDDVEESLLKEVYVTEELTPEEKNELEELRKSNQEMRKDLDAIREFIHFEVNKK